MSGGEPFWQLEQRIHPDVALVGELLKVKDTLSTDLDQIRADMLSMDTLAERIDRLEHQMQDVSQYVAELHRYLTEQRKAAVSFGPKHTL